MEKGMVSVIVPVYNAAAYIKDAIESILGQTYESVELLLIDDGATDGTGEICRDYAKKDGRVRYYRQNHGGVSRARNLGIDMATGDYIAFADHDDLYERTYLQELVDLAGKEDLDVVKCGVLYQASSIGNARVSIERKAPPAGVYNRSEFLDHYIALYPFYSIYVWNGLYRAAALKENGIRFPEEFRYGNEDMYFNIALAPFVRKIGFVNRCLYRHYRRQRQSNSATFHEEFVQTLTECMALEERVLAPLFAERSWEAVRAVLYAKKITAIIAYCSLNSETEALAMKRCAAACATLRRRCAMPLPIPAGIGRKNKMVLALFRANCCALMIWLWRRVPGARRPRMRCCSAETLLREGFEIDSAYYEDVLKGHRLLCREKGLRLADLRYRYWDGRGAVPLDQAAPYRYLKGDRTAYEAYIDYQRAHGFPVPQLKRYDELIRSVRQNGYRSNSIIIVNGKNWLRDGQHRACILADLYGLDHEIEVLEVTRLVPKELVKLCIPDALLDYITMKKNAIRNK